MKDDIKKDFDSIEFLTEEEIQNLNVYELLYYYQSINQIDEIYNSIMKGDQADG